MVDGLTVSGRMVVLCDGSRIDARIDPAGRTPILDRSVQHFDTEATTAADGNDVRHSHGLSDVVCLPCNRPVGRPIPAIGCRGGKPHRPETNNGVNAEKKA